MSFLLIISGNKLDNAYKSNLHIIWLVIIFTVVIKILEKYKKNMKQKYEGTKLETCQN